MRRGTYDSVDGDDFAENDAEGRECAVSWLVFCESEQREGLHLMRFLVVILGARTPPPRIEEPVMKIPL